MKVIDHIENSNETLFSFEIVPPMRGGTITDITNIVKAIQPLNPSWIDVTAHSASANYNELPDGTVEKRVFKKRPGTIGICGIIQNKFKIDTVAHILCQGFTKEETEDALLELNFLGIHNVLAIKGDGLNYKKDIAKNKTQNPYACDLVEQIANMRKGIFLEELTHGSSLDFGIGIAGYPEKHFEAPNMKSDISFAKLKIEKGAEYIVTQMFYDNKQYFEYVEMCRDAGITVPIVPGLKVLRTKKQLNNIPRHFYINLPDELVDQVNSDPDNVLEAGMNRTIKQAKELLEANVPSLHFYIMNDADAIVRVCNELKN